MLLGSKDSEKGTKSLWKPRDKTQKMLIDKILRRASQELKLYNIDIDNGYKLYTIVVLYVESFLKFLNSNYEKFGVDKGSLYDYIDIALSVRTAEDAEKNGNINIVVSLGDKGRDIMDNFTEYAKVPTVPEPIPKEEDTTYNLTLKSLVTKALVPYNIFITAEDEALATAIRIFFKSAIIITVAETLINSAVSIEIGELFSINGRVEDGKKLIINCLPSADGKLLIKSDSSTEDEE